VNNFQINKLYENNFEVTIINSISKLAISKIKTGMTISLGGGHNVMNLAEELHQSSITNITLCSPSELTRMNVHPLDEIKWIDLAFDGCDSVDYQLNALKSGGGIHLFEKIAAQMSKEYILLVPEKRVQKELSSKVPLCIEVAEPAIKKF
ncbi:ribose-5-phosphate isomerase A, partial [Lactobacillus helveticus]|uniref:ribose-5-phosphate isomerase A n=2 Tax=Lactobacillus helveticus TaxID=1587 RepID=UPI00345E4F93